MAAAVKRKGTKRGAAKRKAAPPKAAPRTAKASSGTRARSTATSEEEQQPPAGPRPLWSGTVTFALVSVPVDLYPASRDAGLKMNLLAPDGTPLESHYVCPEHGAEVEWQDIARADETEEGFVVLTEEELAAAEPRRSRDIEITSFVPSDVLEPLMIERTFVLTPTGGSTKPYRLLARALEDAGLAGMATFVLRRRERLVAVIARDGILWAVALRFEDEVRPLKELGLPKKKAVPAAAQRAMETALQGLKKKRWSTEDLEDEGEARLRSLVEKKRRRHDDVIAAPAEPEAPAVESGPEGEEDGEAPELFEVIQRRLRGEGGRGSRKRAGRKSRASA
jgi:DNA end-binding protein Ku